LPEIEWEDDDTLWRPRPAGASSPFAPPAPPSTTGVSSPAEPVVSWARADPTVAAAVTHGHGRAEAGPSDVPDADSHFVESPSVQQRSIIEKWPMIAGLGFGGSWCLWLVGYVWSLWRQSVDGSFGGSGVTNISTGEHISLWLQLLGNQLFGLLGLIGVGALTVYACSSDRRHRLASIIAAMYVVLGAIFLASAAWTGLQHLHGDSTDFSGYTRGGGPDRLTTLAGVLAGAVTIALAIIVLLHRTAGVSCRGVIGDPDADLDLPDPL
jgi:hypothetical protein